MTEVEKAERSKPQVPPEATSARAASAVVPFDEQSAVGVTTAELNLALVREFLHAVHSDLCQEQDAERVYRAMQIVSPVNGHSVPRNVGLLFFSVEPRRFFRGARIEVVEFLDEASGNTHSERIFEGPIHEQVRQCLSYLESLTSRYFEKQDSMIETRGWISFPIPALREAVVNAIYHRSYEDSEDSVEPTKIYLYPDRIEIISYPGPVPGIEMKHLDGTASPPPVPARNRRIGEYMKELRLAESRGTGLPKMRRTMAENGSPPPRFDFNAERTYFRVTLPAHPEYVVLTILRDYAYAKATGDLQRARRLLAQAWASGSRSVSLLVAMIREHVEQGDLAAADQLIEEMPPNEVATYARALTTLAAAHADAKSEGRSKELLNRLPELMAPRDAFEAAIVERRLGRDDRAHRLFERAGDLVLQDARALHEFAQAKLKLAGRLHRSKSPADQQVHGRLLKEALAYLERVVQMDAPATRHAWAWFNIGQARSWLRAPRQSVIDAFRRAYALGPNETRFGEELAKAQASTPDGEV